jgi:general secretion pathway protein H
MLRFLPTLLPRRARDSADETSRALADSRRQRGPFRGPGRAGSRLSLGRGFTLIEILVVVALIALAVTLVTVTVGSGLSGAKVKAASRDLVAALRYTRGQAIVKHEEKTMSIDVEKRRYRATGKKWIELPKDMTMKLFTARSELEEEGVGRIRFFPDGSSTGGHIDLLKEEAVWRIEVLWLTGEVSLREGAQSP